MTAAARVLFFAAVVVAMKAMFDPDINARLVAFEPLGNLPIVVRGVALHLPYGLFAALLLTRAEVWRRLPSAIAWYVVLLVLAVTVFVPDAIAASHAALLDLVAHVILLLLIAAIVMLLTRLTPKPGFIYEGSSFPSVKAFLALTLLLALSIGFVTPIEVGTRMGAILERIPVAYLNLVVAAIVVAAFIAVSGVRFRSLQPNASSGWMTLGILLWILAQLLEPVIPLLRTYGLARERAAVLFIDNATAIKAGLEIAAHVALLIGCFLLLSHLLPERDRIARQ